MGEKVQRGQGTESERLQDFKPTGFVQVLENLEFYFDIFQDWKVLEKDYRVWIVLEICLIQAMKFSEFTS